MAALLAASLSTSEPHALHVSVRFLAAALPRSDSAALPDPSCTLLPPPLALIWSVRLCFAVAVSWNPQGSSVAHVLASLRV